MKQDVVKLLKEHLSAITQARRTLQSESGQYISKKSLRQKMEEIACAWFDTIEPKLKLFGIPVDVLGEYSVSFKQLLKLSSGPNRYTSYENCLNKILGEYQGDLILAVQTFNKGQDIDPILFELLTEIKDPDESEYLSEAIKCVEKGYLKAGVTLGWSAAIDRIHRKIEEIGFDKFNSASISMAGQTRGRFKAFNQKQSISSLSELRMVFDSVILWVIEGMNLIDSNQHTRLGSCFDMRCHAAHPGEAPITKYNVISFFSDLNEIIFKHSLFTLKSHEASSKQETFI